MHACIPPRSFCSYHASRRSGGTSEVKTSTRIPSCAKIAFSRCVTSCLSVKTAKIWHRRPWLSSNLTSSTKRRSFAYAMWASKSGGLDIRIRSLSWVSGLYPKAVRSPNPNGLSGYSSKAFILTLRTD